MLEKQSQSNVKLNNLRLILKMLIQHDTLSRADLVRLTYISKPTVSNLIEELINLNLVREVGAGVSKTGRKPILLKFNSTLKYFLVFTIGREEYHVAVADLKGQICESYIGEFSISQSYHDRLSLLKVSMQNLLDRLHISHDKLLKIHGAAPGVFIEKDQALSWSGHEIPKDQDTQTYLENIFQTPVILNHSSKIALYGEKIAGMARDANHAVYIDIGYGLGCSFMFNNQVYFGANNSAGEIGYVYSDLKEFENYKLAPYGWGALETIISGKAFQQKGRDLAIKHREICNLSNRFCMLTFRIELQQKQCLMQPERMILMHFLY